MSKPAPAKIRPADCDVHRTVEKPELYDPALRVKTNRVLMEQDKVVLYLDGT